MGKINVENMDLYYGQFHALKNINLDIPEKKITAFIGPSGCGKSTLLKSLNRMNDLVEGCKITGDIRLDGEDIYGNIDVNLLRKRVGMVFQNPDNQIVAAVVEEDVAFGPENLGIPSAEIRQRVDAALEAVNMTEYREHSPHLLSGGQKQRIAIAGVLAMKPDCIVLDEPTAMLDPKGRREVLETVHKLNKEEGITIVFITHFMEEAVTADRVVVMKNGVKLHDGTPREIFSHVDTLKELGLDVPVASEIAFKLNAKGYEVGNSIINNEELAEGLKSSLAMFAGDKIDQVIAVGLKEG